MSVSCRFVVLKASFLIQRLMFFSHVFFLSFRLCHCMHASVVCLCERVTHPWKMHGSHPPPPHHPDTFRSRPELVQSQLRRVVSGGAGERDGAVAEHGAPPAGRRRGRSQPHGQPLQHQPARRPRPQPDRVEAEEGAEQGQLQHLRTQAQGKQTKTKPKKQVCPSQQPVARNLNH